MKPLTSDQRDALRALMDALRLATNSGLFDSDLGRDSLPPDIVNRFCDGAEEMKIHGSDRV